MTEQPDDLADLLGPQQAAPSPALRDAVLRQTERRLARDRWVRHGARAAVVVGVFVAGGLAGWQARTPVAHAPGSPATVIEVVAVPVVVPVVRPPVADAPGSPAPPLSASAAELRAEQQDDENEAAKLYRQAGDAFLRDQDYSNATRCYRLFLARGGDAALALEPKDSWLLVSLKNAAFKEKADATKNDG